MVDKEDFDYILTFDEIKQIFEDVKKASKDNRGRLENVLESKLGDAIADAGRQELHQFTDDIWLYLDYPWDYIQEEAIQSLGYPHKIFDQAFRDKAYEIWHDETRTEHTRFIALGIWCCYYKNTKDSSVLEEFYKVFTQCSSFTIRTEALLCIFDICGIKLSYQQSMSIYNWADKKSHEYINEHTDWDRIHELMRQYAPNVELVDPKTLNIPNP